MSRLLSRSLLPILTVLIVLIGASLRADSDVVVDKLNKKIDNITLKDAAGKPRSLYDLKDKKAVVVVFLSFECPVSTSYSSVLAELAKTYRDKQVAFVAVNSSDDGDAAQLAKQAAEYKMPFPVFKDESFRAADAFKADIVPSAFVLDRNFVLRYRGRIDDGYYARLKKNGRITQHDLRQALDEVLAGKAVSEPATKPIGCAIVRERKTRKDGAVTYYRDVLPIVQKQLPGVPSSRRGRAVRADDLQTSGQLGRRHQGIHAGTQDAAVEAGRGAGLPQRTQAVGQGHSKRWRPGWMAARPKAMPRTRRRRDSSSRAGSSASPISC